MTATRPYRMPATVVHRQPILMPRLVRETSSTNYTAATTHQASTAQQDTPLLARLRGPTTISPHRSCILPVRQTQPLAAAQRR